MEKINILLSSNESYWPGTRVLIYSLYKNHSNDHPLSIYFMYYDETIQVAKEVENLCSKLNIESHLIPVTGVVLDNLKKAYRSIQSSRFTIENFFRLLAPALLPEEIDRVLWLDSDCLVQNNIEDLYFTNIDNYLIASLTHRFEEFNNIFNGVNIEKYSFKIPQVNIKASVVLFNLKALRKNPNFYLSKMEKLLYSNRSLGWSSQDLLNALCFGNILYLNKNKYGLDIIFSISNFKELDKLGLLPTHLSIRDIIICRDTYNIKKNEEEFRNAPENIINAQWNRVLDEEYKLTESWKSASILHYTWFSKPWFNYIKNVSINQTDLIGHIWYELENELNQIK